MTDIEKMTKILSDLRLISNTDCLGQIATTAKNRKSDLMRWATLSWEKEDNVQLLPEYQHRKPYDAIGKIVKINKVKMQVNFSGVVWNVPKTMLVKAK